MIFTGKFVFHSPTGTYKIKKLCNRYGIIKFVNKYEFKSPSQRQYLAQLVNRRKNQTDPVFNATYQTRIKNRKRKRWGRVDSPISSPSKR
jgi:hypothetical protein